MDNPLIGICLVGETETSYGHIMGAIHPPSPTQNLTKFRSVVNSTVLQNFTLKPYVFLTASGWEINEELEITVKVSDIVTRDGMVKIRICYQRPRLGIVLEGNPACPIGFVFCDLNCTIQDILDEIQQQLPSLHQSLVSTSFSFLDRNGWPVNKEQEKLLTALEIVSDSTLRIRCTPKHARKLSLHSHADQMPPLRPISPLPYLTSISRSSLPAPIDPTASLSPVVEVVDRQEVSSLEQSLSSDMYYDSMKLSSTPGAYEFKILISYVHTEASDYAFFLKDALEKLGYTVFLDTSCIESGTDWQDALNVAISNCLLFIPLVTVQYGETLWTNREVKLADVLGKIIIPVNFVPNWPPKCLGIQFATTQYITWKNLSGETTETISGKQEGGEEEEEEIAASVAASIAVRYQRELKSEQPELDEKVGTGDSQQTQPVEIIVAESPGVPRTPPLLNLMRKMSTLKSYADALPETLPAIYRKLIQESRQGKPLVVVSCHSAQREFVKDLLLVLEDKHFEIWCSDSLEETDEKNARRTFQEKADEAGVVVFVISQEFASSEFCEQQVYYCEQRKRIVPVICGAVQLPHWLSMLVGTNTFIDCRSTRYKSAFLERVETAFNTVKADQELKTVLKQKAEVAKMCSELVRKLPKGKHIYISGGTKFYSACGEAICKELGRQLAQDPELIVVTGGFFGVGDTVARSFYDERLGLKQPHGVCHVVAIRDDQDKSHQTRQNSDGTFPPVPYGDTLFFGSSVRQREMLTPRVLDVCILVEGGPGAAFEAQQFTWNGNKVVPVMSTGGAAGGSFDIPQSVFNRPLNVLESDWSILANKQASPRDIASALVRIVTTLKASGPTTPRLKRKHASVGISSAKFKRSETMPTNAERPHESQPMKRTYSESR